MYFPLVMFPDVSGWAEFAKSPNQNEIAVAIPPSSPPPPFSRKEKGLKPLAGVG
jgi:hypothetical protein